MYVYERRNEWWDQNDLCKLGIAKNIPERDATYVTSEIRRGYFHQVFEILSEIPTVAQIERQLHREFHQYHWRGDAGVEFYKRDISVLIEHCLKKWGISYKLLSADEVKLLTRTSRLRMLLKKVCVNSFKRTIQQLAQQKRANNAVVENATVIQKRPYQQEIEDDVVRHFKCYDKGVVILTCGLGKTLLSLWIVQRLKMRLILIAVPSVELLKQWNSVVARMFPDAPVLIVGGNQTTVSVDDISVFIGRKHGFVITTYASSYKINRACRGGGGGDPFDNVWDTASVCFDLKILDEVHHITSTNAADKMDEEARTFLQVLNIPSNKQLALTATVKNIERTDNTSNILVENIVSNDNTEYFGEIIACRSLLWAITHKYVCDYCIQTPVCSEDDMNDVAKQCELSFSNNQHAKRLYMAAMVALKSIYYKHSHHILIYSNSVENATAIVEYLRVLLQKYFTSTDDEMMRELYCSTYNGEMSDREKDEIKTNFVKSKFGIISCVYCLQEGWDCPLLDAVVFSENMSSVIRILQSMLRPNRKNSDEPNKIAKIILPVLQCDDDWLQDDNNTDFKKVREIIGQVGREDENVAHKISVSKLKMNFEPLPLFDDAVKSDFHGSAPMILGETDEIMTERLRVKTVSRIRMSHFGYTQAKNQIKKYGGASSKGEYVELCLRDNRFSKDPEETYGSKFLSWADYLSLDASIYYTLNECTCRIKELFREFPQLKLHSLPSTLCKELCEKDPKFPPCEFWADFYRIEVSTLLHKYLNKIKRNRKIYIDECVKLTK